MYSVRTIVSDRVEGLVTENSYLGGRVRRLGTESRVVLSGGVVSVQLKRIPIAFYPLPSGHGGRSADSWIDFALRRSVGVKVRDGRGASETISLLMAVSIR